MPRAVVGAGPYKSVWYLPVKLQFSENEWGKLMNKEELTALVADILRGMETPSTPCAVEKETEERVLAPVFDHEEIEHYMRTSGGKVIRRKGATFYAVSVSTCHIVKSILSA